MPPESSNNEEIKQLLLENQKLLTENNKLLKKMRRDAVVGFIFRVLYIVIIFGLPFYFYLYFIQPNIGSIKEQVGLFQSLTGSGSDQGSWTSLFNKSPQ